MTSPEMAVTDVTTLGQMIEIDCYYNVHMQPADMIVLK